MKKVQIKMTILIILTVLIGFTPSYAKSCGDVNSEDTVNIVDALLIAQYSVRILPENFNKGMADINNDGSTNIIDALRIAQFYIRIIESLPGSPDF